MKPPSRELSRARPPLDTHGASVLRLAAVLLRMLASMSGMRLLAGLALLVACEPQNAGSFSVEFRFRDGAPPSDAAYHVFARVEQDRPAGNSVTAEAARYRSGLSLQFANVPYGKGYRVIVEVRASEDPASRVEYSGQSEEFELAPGKHRVVPVPLSTQLAPTPSAAGTSSDDLGALAVLEAVRDEARAVVSTPVVTLVLAPQAAERVVIAHDPSFSLGRTERKLSDLAVQSDGRYHLKGWDLNKGLCTTCLDGTRAVYARFYNAQGYASDVYSTQVVLDTTAPQLVGEATLTREPAFAPALADEGRVLFSATDPFTQVATTARVLVMSDEPALRPELRLLNGAGQAEFAFTLVARRGNSAEFVHQFTAPLAEAGEYLLEIRWEDAVGNQAHHLLNVLLEWSDAAPEGLDQEATLYTRTPWGSDHTNGKPAFSVRGSLRGDAESRAAGVIALRGEDVSTGFQIGSALADQDGVFEIPQLTGGDLSKLYVAPFSRAGVVGPVELVRRNAWVATMGGKVARSTQENPHTFSSLPDAPIRLFGDEQGVNEYGASLLATRDDGGVTSRSDGVWTQRDVKTRQLPELSYLGIAYDSARGKLVYYNDIDTWEWDGTSWTARTSVHAPEPRYPNYEPNAHSLVYDSARGVVLLFRARNSFLKLPAETWEWDGADWTQRESEHVPDVSYTHSLGYDPLRRKAVLVSGIFSSGETAYTWEWDGLDWTLVTPAHSPRRGGGPFAYDPRSKALLLVDASVSPAATWQWDGVDWKQSEPAHQPGGNGSLVFDARLGKMILLSSDGATRTWDGTDWTELPLEGASAAGLLAYDSLNDVTTAVGASSNYSFATWVFDGVTWHQRQLLPASPSARQGHGMTYDPVTHLTIMQGGRSFRDPPNGTWAWNGEQWTDLAIGGAPPETLGTMAFDEGRDLALFVTETGSTWEWRRSGWTQYPDAARVPSGALVYDASRAALVMVAPVPWTWDGAQWNASSPTRQPSAVAPGTSAYDAARERIVTLYPGSYENGYEPETWEWDGSDWNFVEPAHEPPFGGALVYDEARARVVFFGNESATANMHTWEWDGVDWREREPVNRPAGRYLFPMTYDRERDRVVLFGGRKDFIDPVDLGDTWELRAASVRPCHLLHIDLSAAHLPGHASLQGLDWDVAVGASSTVDGISAPGAELSAWSLGSWRTLGAHTSDAQTPGALTFHADARDARNFVLRDQIYTLACPLGTNGSGTAEVTTDYAALVVHYNLGDET